MNEKLLSAFLLSSLCATSLINAQQIAFPGAEGWGRFATGGRAIDERGSNIYFVTTLEDYLDSETPIEGSLRWALNTGDDTPRTILFKVGGTINLKSRLKAGKPNVTIAGQSAPGGGICISGANIYMHSNNYIVRHLRFRAGDISNSNYSALGIENAQNIIIDHCSFSWSMEENVTMYDNKYTTMQWCILSEPLYYTRHQKGERGYGSQWGGEHSSYHHNLIAHCVSRAPRVNGARDKSSWGHDFFVDTEIVNNVIYNWGNKGAVYGGELEAVVEDAYSYTNLINNYYKPGPTTNTFQERWFADMSHTSSKATGLGRWHVEGNMFEINEYKNDKNKGDHTAVNNNNWLYAEESNSKKALNPRAGIDFVNDIKLTEASATGEITVQDAYSAYKDVVKYAGAQLPKLDEVDARILAEAAGEIAPKDYGTVKVGSTTKYPGIINSQDDLKPEGAGEEWSAWPDLSMKENESLPIDTDNDGIPDAWEDANGLDSNNADDSALIASNGYSNLENYLNSIVATSIKESVTESKNELKSFYDKQNRKISFNAGVNPLTLDIYSVHGAKVKSTDVSAASTVDCTSLNKGIYILNWILKTGETITEKMIIR